MHPETGDSMEIICRGFVRSPVFVARNRLSLIVALPARARHDTDAIATPDQTAAPVPLSDERSPQLARAAPPIIGMSAVQTRRDTGLRRTVALRAQTYTGIVLFKICCNATVISKRAAFPKPISAALTTPNSSILFGATDFGVSDRTGVLHKRYVQQTAPTNNIW
mmetsp:Transcript_42260/g.82948  ORF Transcript_42260/g.82948 Transcript_42260/m.82948 type:complete len:165 (-) Transcript_42260:330-824(-)